MKKRGRPSKQQQKLVEENPAEIKSEIYFQAPLPINPLFLSPANFSLPIIQFQNLKQIRPKIQPNQGFHQNLDPEDFTEIAFPNYQQNFSSYILVNILHRRKQILSEYDYKLTVFKQIITQILPIQQKFSFTSLQKLAKSRPEYNLIQQIKQISGRLFNSGKRLRILQNEEILAFQQQKIRRIKINFILQQTQNMCTQITSRLETLDKSPPLLLNKEFGELRPYQIQGFNFLLSCTLLGYNAILADDLGLGKSLQTIALLAKLAEFNIFGPHLIIVPSTLLYNWENEFKKWFPACNVIIYFGNKQEREKIRSGWSYEKKFSVILTSYNIAVSDAQILKRKQFFFLIMDEAHLIRNSSSRAWNVLLTFNSVQKLLISGTPISNSASDIWSLLHFVLPTFFASKAEFLSLFARDIERMADGELGVSQKLIRSIHALLRPFMLRRLKSEVENELPEKKEFLIPCPLSRKQLYLYSEYMHGSENNGYMQIVNLLTQLRKICNHPILVEESAANSGFVFEGIYQQDTISSVVIEEISGNELENVYVRGNGFWNNFGQFLPKEIRQERMIVCNQCQCVVIDKMDKGIIKIGQDNVDLEELYKHFDDKPKRARKMLVGQLDYQFVRCESYQNNLLVALQKMRNFQHKQHYCVGCLKKQQLDSSLNGFSNVNYIQDNMLYFEKSSIFDVNQIQVSRSCDYLREMGDDNLMFRGCAFSFNNRSSLSYCFQESEIAKIRDFKDFKAQMSQEYEEYCWDEMLVKSQQHIVSDQLLKVQHGRTLIQSLNKPFYDYNTHNSFFDTRIALQLSIFTSVMKKAFLGSQIIENSTNTLTKMLSEITLTTEMINYFQVYVEKAIVSPYLFCPLAPSIAGQYRSNNYFLNEIYSINSPQLLEFQKQFKIPFPNQFFNNTTKIITLMFKYNLKLMRLNQVPHLPFYNSNRNNKQMELIHNISTPLPILNSKHLEQKIPLPTQDEILTLKTKNASSKLHFVKDQLQIVNSNSIFHSKKQQLFRSQIPSQNSNLGRVLLHLTVPKLSFFSIVNAPISQQQLYKQPYCALLTEAGQACGVNADYQVQNSYSFNDHSFNFRRVSPTEFFTFSEVYNMHDNAFYADLDEVQNVICRPRTIKRSGNSNLNYDLHRDRFLRFQSTNDLISDSGKLLVLKSLLQSLYSKGSKCLIFTQQTKFLDILESFLTSQSYVFYRMDGSTPPKQRQNLVDKFNAFKHVFAFIMTTRTGGIGLNLTGADTVIFVDTDWNPQVHQQATDRVHRINQVRKVQVFTLVSEFTIEENIVRRATQKRNLDKIILKNGAFVPEFFEKNEKFQMSLDKRALEVENQIQLVYSSLVDNKQVKSRLGDVLEAFCDDDDVEAKNALISEQMGDMNEEKEEEFTVVESGKQLMEQVEIFTEIEQSPPVWLRFFERGFESIQVQKVNENEKVEIFGFEVEKRKGEKDWKSKNFQNYEVDFGKFEEIRKDLEKYAEEEMEQDVAKMDVQKVKIKGRKLEVTIRARKTFIE